MVDPHRKPSTTLTYRRVAWSPCLLARVPAPCACLQQSAWLGYAVVQCMPEPSACERGPCGAAGSCTPRWRSSRQACRRWGWRRGTGCAPRPTQSLCHSGTSGAGLAPVQGRWVLRKQSLCLPEHASASLHRNAAQAGTYLSTALVASGAGHAYAQS